MAVAAAGLVKVAMNHAPHETSQPGSPRWRWRPASPAEGPAEEYRPSRDGRLWVFLSARMHARLRRLAEGRQKATVGLSEHVEFVK